jgi:hypothetical protein
MAYRIVLEPPGTFMENPPRPQPAPQLGPSLLPLDAVISISSSYFIACSATKQIRVPTKLFLLLTKKAGNQCLVLMQAT